VTLPLSYFRNVPEEGLEPPCLTAPHPKCGVTANSTIRAFGGRRGTRTPTTFRSAVFKTAAIPLCDSSVFYSVVEIGLEPILFSVKARCLTNLATPQCVGDAGFEPTTSRSQSERYTGLSQSPITIILQTHQFYHTSSLFSNRS
jgi:hypothetical protein